MRILKVIHGFPPLFNAGSEVYSHSIAKELSRSNQVVVFTREEDSFRDDFSLRTEVLTSQLEVTYVNNPNGKDGYRHQAIDEVFKRYVEGFKPDVAHIGHLNHLSTGLIDVLHEMQVPIVFTLHDFWLMCPRGQFLTRSIGQRDNFRLCDKQEDSKCAQDCYSVYHSGRAEDSASDLQMWSDWVSRRMRETIELSRKVDLFIAPSRYLRGRFIRDFDLPEAKIKYLDYGFPLDHLKPVKGSGRKEFTFGYIGTHIPAKGIDLLIKAFREIKTPSKLIIFGRERGEYTNALKRLSSTSINEIEFRPEYKNDQIVSKVFEEIDAIVVPSIWSENSPLVIHEAQACHIPVITANIGGMREYVEHRTNGLLFEHRSVRSLRQQMVWALNNREQMRILGRSGYLYDTSGKVPSITEHCSTLERVYKDVQKKFWRLTIDTNPEDCNLSCTMCEEHSPFSDYIKVKLRGKRRRMPKEWLEDIFTQASRLGIEEIIPSTMGEPILYKHFDRITELCNQHKVKMNLTTNGSFPKVNGKSVHDWAKAIIPITSDIKFSWNGATSETSEKIMIGIDFDRTVENVKTFVKVRNSEFERTGHYCQFTFQLTFLEDNMHELDDIIRLAAELDIDRVKGHHLWAHFDEIAEQNFKRNNESIERWNAYVQSAKKVVKKNLRPNGSMVRLENISVLDINATKTVSDEKECPFLGKELWISATGKYAPCCAPDEQRQALGDFGSFPERSIEDVLNSEQYKNLQKNYKDNELCKNCLMRK